MLAQRTTFFTALLFLLCCRFVFCIEPAIDSHDENVDVPSLLRKQCSACHGGDVQESGLRLDNLESILQGGQSGPVIDREQIPRSELLQRIRSHDTATRMPPEGVGISERDADAIENWIRTGMEWTIDRASQEWNEHWAYQPLRKPAPPLVHNEKWPINPIDAFVLSRLESEGHAPGNRADAKSLTRRLYLNLIGLPPSVDDLQSLGSESENYEQVTEQLLASPFFGERWARHWLDVVRFAESNGFETNQPRRNAWYYRDYVVQSMNSDKPFDDFVREQLAGDQLGADAATGFLVGGAWDEVKSPDPVLTANQRADEQHDMVSTTCSTFLGLTVGCARCHSHKFDPISQRDYYAVKASLSGVQHGERALNSQSQSARLKEAQSLRGLLAPIEKQLASSEARAHIGQTVIIDDSSSNYAALRTVSGEAIHFAGTGRGELDQSASRFGFPNIGKKYQWFQADANESVAAYTPNIEGDFRVWISWGAGYAVHSTDARYVMDLDGNLETTQDQIEIAKVDQRNFSDGSDAVHGRPLWSGFYDAGVHAIQHTSKLVVRCGAIASPVSTDVVLFQRIADLDDAFSTGSNPHLRAPVQSQINTENIKPTQMRFIRFSIDATTDAEPCIDELLCMDADGHNVALGVKSKSSGDYAGNSFHQLKHINDGIFGNEKSWISNQPGKGWVELEFPDLVTIHRIQWSRDGSASPKYQDRVATKYSIASSVDGTTWEWIASDQDRLPRNYPHSISQFQSYSVPTGRELGEKVAPHGTERIERLIEERAQLLAKISSLESQTMVYAGRLEMPKATPRLHRGDPMHPRETVPPGGLEKFGTPWTLSEDAPDAERRLKLAQWIATPSNPLTARVIVNRLWHYHFGVGLVDTPSDFGLNGGRPSHPALLDWLACELIEHDWSLKHIHRLIVLSATYRQTSTPSPSGIGISDRLLGRFPSRRVEAEALRDSLLSITGSLRLESGGPGFDLFEPNSNYVKVYLSKNNPGSDTWRRMVYQTKPRMQLEHTFGSFDCPDAGQVAPKRTRSVTPLQALSLFNSPFMNEQAELFAKRLIREATTEPDRIARAFWLAYSRAPDDEEQLLSNDFVRQNGLVAFCRALLNSSEWMVIE